jgi:hypothetical protein
VRQVADKCGAFSAFSTVGDKDWAVWAATTGLQIFDGGVPFKISQEIQTRWDAINPEAQQSVWIESDPVVKRFYVGVPTGTHEGPDSIEVLDYRELESGSQVASSNSLRISLAGKMIASDLTRKWTHWNLACGFGRVLNSSLNGKRMVFGAGSGDAPGDAAGFGNVYYLDADKLTDDDYGAMSPYYVTYAFVNHEQEQQLGTGLSPQAGGVSRAVRERRREPAGHALRRHADERVAAVSAVAARRRADLRPRMRAERAGGAHLLPHRAAAHHRHRRRGLHQRHGRELRPQQAGGDAQAGADRHRAGSDLRWR